MARKRTKKALYELIGKAATKTPHIEVEQSAKPEKNISEQRREGQGTAQIPQRSKRLPNKPRLIQFNAGRVEMSIPYEVGAALLLTVVLLVLMAFQLGKRQRDADENLPANRAEIEQPIETDGGERSPAEAGTENVSAVESESSSVSGEENKTAEIQQGGDHVIVIQEFGRSKDLMPVQKHFANHGIDTSIVQQHRRYFLVTSKTFENPHNKGTNGQKMLQKIREVGARYKGKAPEGFETFAPNYFKDAYGKKIK